MSQYRWFEVIPNAVVVVRNSLLIDGHNQLYKKYMYSIVIEESCQKDDIHVDANISAKLMNEEQ